MNITYARIIISVISLTIPSTPFISPIQVNLKFKLQKKTVR